MSDYSNVQELIEAVEQVIDSISEQELTDADMVVARELAEQLMEELQAIEPPDDE